VERDLRGRPAGGRRNSASPGRRSPMAGAVNDVTFAPGQARTIYSAQCRQEGRSRCGSSHRTRRRRTSRIPTSLMPSRSAPTGQDPGHRLPRRQDAPVRHRPRALSPRRSTLTSHRRRRRSTVLSGHRMARQVLTGSFDKTLKTVGCHFGSDGARVQGVYGKRPSRRVTATAVFCAGLQPGRQRPLASGQQRPARSSCGTWLTAA